MNTNENLKHEAEIAQFRFAIIAPVVQGLFTDASKTAYFKRVSDKPLTLPDGSLIKYSYKTIESWYNLYTRGGIDALMPAPRSDKNTSRSLSEEAIEEIYRLKKKFPRLNATQIHDRLVENSFIPATLHVTTVQRFIKKNGLKYNPLQSIKDRKAFEMEFFGELWQADTCYICHLTEGGKSRQVYAVCIIDDHSRMLVGADLFYADNAANFQKVFKTAIATFGIPQKLLVDNGGPYSNEQLSLICGEVGTVLIHAHPRDGAEKAKIERQWRTAKTRWLYGLDLDDFHTLDELRAAFADYVRDYNIHYHGGIDGIPHERWIATKDHIRIPSSQDWLEECFLNRITRHVHKDATVSIDKVSYDVPLQFISQTVDIRYIPNDMTSAFILYDGKRYPIRKTNKIDNAHTRRSKVMIDYDKIGGDYHAR